MQFDWLSNKASCLSSGFPEKMVLLDCETTGGNALRHRVIEIGAIIVDQGKIIDSWRSLCNPERHLPENIQRLTGISPAMLESAPTFSDISDELLELIEGRIFVAHNARFDFSFLKNEFDREGVKLNLKPLCSVKFSRLLYPQFKRHGLTEIINRFKFQILKRHRALDDAQIIYDFFLESTNLFDRNEIASVCNTILKTPSMPPFLNPKEIKKLPKKPGIYYFKNEFGDLLYVGKSVNIKNRVMSHFSQDYRNPKDLRISSQVRSVEFEETPTDFGAQLLESEQIKALQPTLNRRLRRTRQLYRFRLGLNSEGYKVVSIEASNVNSENSGLGLFRSVNQAKSVLSKLADEHYLCHKLLGLDKTSLQDEKKLCFQVQLKKCFGACGGTEPVYDYNSRLEAALANYRLKVWPWDSAILVKEQDPNDAENFAFHLLNNWQHIRKIEDEQELAESGYRAKKNNLPSGISKNPKQSSSGYPADLDTYHILIRFLLDSNKLGINNLRIFLLEPILEG